MDFHLLNKVLNVPLHGVQVRLDGVEHDFVFASPRFETVRMFEFSCTIAACSLGVITPEHGQLVQELPWVLSRFSVNHRAETGPDIQHHDRIFLAVQSERVLPHNRPVNVPFIVQSPVLFEDAGLLVISCAVASGHSFAMPAMPAPLELAPPELAPPELGRFELMAVQMLCYAPPEPEVCFHFLRHRRCSAIVPLGRLPLLAPRSVLYRAVDCFVPSGCDQIYDG